MENVLKEEPVVVPGGDVICIAASVESLGRVLAKKRAGVTSVVPQVTALPNMISKQLYDDAQTSFKDEIARLKATHKQEIDNLNLEHETTVLKLQSSIAQKDQEIVDLKSQTSYWKSFYHAGSDVGILREKILQEQIRTMKMNEDLRTARDKEFWDNVKMIGTLITTVASAAVAVASISNKKGK